MIEISPTVAAVIASIATAIGGFFVARNARRETREARDRAARASLRATIATKKERAERSRRKLHQKIEARNREAVAVLENKRRRGHREIDVNADTIEAVADAKQAAEVLRRAFDG